MPGKVNPSILEALKMVCLHVQGNHETIRLCTEATQLELNVMTPVLAANLFESQQLLTNALRLFREKCLKHMQPTTQMKTILNQSLSIATALNPYLGYDVVAFLVKKSITHHETLEKTLQKTGILTSMEIRTLFHAANLISPQKIDTTLKNQVQSRKTFTQFRKHVQKFAR